MIRWKLNEIMARQRISNRRFAELMGAHENSIGRLRRSDVMPRLAHDTLNDICKHLGVQPADLLSYEPDKE